MTFEWNQTLNRQIDIDKEKKKSKKIWTQTQTQTVYNFKGEFGILLFFTHSFICVSTYLRIYIIAINANILYH